MNKDWTEQESYWGMVSDEPLEGAFASAIATAESPGFAENRYGATWIENDDGEDIPDITSEIDYDIGDDGSQAVDETEVIGIENDDAGNIQQALPSPAAKYAQGDEVEETEIEHDGVGDFHQVSLFPAAKHTQVEYDNRDGLSGVPAIYHHEIRHELLVAAREKGTYTFFQPRGLGEDDETSFFEPQQHWSWFDRFHYPPINHVYKPHKIMKKGRFLYQRETYKLKNWYYNGKLVVDRNKDIVRKFRNIPDVLSSQYPGAFLEAIKREDRRISYIDILARMPSKIKIDIGNGLYTEKALYCSTTLLRRSTNFRLRAGILCWARNDVNKAMERFLEENLPQDLKDLNTTFGFRDLTLYEQDMINGQNEWKSPSELEALYDVK